MDVLRVTFPHISIRFWYIICTWKRFFSLVIFSRYSKPVYCHPQHFNERTWKLKRESTNCYANTASNFYFSNLLSIFFFHISNIYNFIRSGIGWIYTNDFCCSLFKQKFDMWVWIRSCTAYSNVHMYNRSLLIKQKKSENMIEFCKIGLPASKSKISMQ